MNHLIVFGVLLLAVVLFAWGKVRHDFVALITLFLLVLWGIVPASSAFAGFSHPAVITVAAVLVIGKALECSGLVDLLGKWVLKLGDNLTVQLLSLSTLVAVASAFMNNVGALTIMMPIAIHIARKSGHPPSYLLMPLAFASLLGGMITLIGTPPNIIISSFRAEVLGNPFNMFDFSPVGLVLTVAGILFISLIGWRLLPNRRSESEGGLFDIEEYITEVIVPEESKIGNNTIGELEKITKAEVQILGLVRNRRRIHVPDQFEMLRPHDIIMLETDAENLKIFLEDTGTKMLGEEKPDIEETDSGKIAFMEAVVIAGSMLIGQTAATMNMRRIYGTNLLAIARREQHIHRRLDQVVFSNGDVLLLQGQENVLKQTISSFGCLPLAERELRLGYKTRIPMALAIFGGAIVSILGGLLPVQVAFGIAAVIMVLTGVLPTKEFYKSIDWPVIVLLGAMIPVGGALETSGGAERIAQLVVGIGDRFPAWAMVAIVLTITMFLSDIINNAATVLLMAPIAVSVAEGLGFSIDPFLMAVAIGGSSAFLTPIGHQSNTLVMGPGGYRFTDYWKMGLLLEIIILVAGVPLIMYLWPV